MFISMKWIVYDHIERNILVFTHKTLMIKTSVYPGPTIWIENIKSLVCFQYNMELFLSLLCISCLYTQL